MLSQPVEVLCLEIRQLNEGLLSSCWQLQKVLINLILNRLYSIPLFLNNRIYWTNKVRTHHVKQLAGWSPLKKSSTWCLKKQGSTPCPAGTGLRSRSDWQTGSRTCRTDWHWQPASRLGSTEIPTFSFGRLKFNSFLI